MFEHVVLERKKAMLKFVSGDKEIKQFSYERFRRVSGFSKVVYYVPDPAILFTPETYDSTDYEAMVAMFSKSLWLIHKYYSDEVCDVVKIGYSAEGVDNFMLKKLENGELRYIGHVVSKMDDKDEVKVWQFWRDALRVALARFGHYFSEEIRANVVKQLDEGFFRFCEVADI